MNAGAPTGAQIRILLATANATLRAIRRDLIESFGFQVSASASADDAVNQIQGEHFEILVLGYTLSSEECCKIARAFRQRQSCGRIVEIAKYDGMTPLNGPDATFVWTDGPAELRYVLEAQAQIVISRLGSVDGVPADD